MIRGTFEIHKDFRFFFFIRNEIKSIGNAVVAPENVLKIMCNFRFLIIFLIEIYVN